MEDQKRRQVEYHENVHYCATRPRQIDNSNPLIEWLNGCRLRKLMEMIGVSLTGKSVLSVCGGDGDEADFFARHGADVTMTDLSVVAVEAARVRNPALRCMRMDTELLAFADGSFDWVVVRDGLHHLARPLKGLYEIERVCREGFAILEGQDSPLVRLLVKVGFGEDWDPAGGYTYRFSRRELYKVFASVQTLSDWKIFTTWLPPGSDTVRHFPVMRFVYPVVYSKAGRYMVQTLFFAAHFLAGRWGNSLIAIGHKKMVAPERLVLARIKDP